MTDNTLKEISALREKTSCLVALAGNPNVGKSTIFNHLTGLGVMTANYPGKTVELNLGSTRIGDVSAGIIDLPGIYSLGCISDDQYVARQTLLENRFDAVIMVLDSTNLARNLYMLLQLVDMGFPVIAALNLSDVAEKSGLQTDIKKLEKYTGVKVIATSAVYGQGIEELMHEALKPECTVETCMRRHNYGTDIEHEIDSIAAALERLHIGFPYPLSYKACALLLLEGDLQFLEFLESMPGREEVFLLLGNAWRKIQDIHGENASLWIIRERHGIAGEIASSVQARQKKKKANMLWKLSTDPVMGFPLLFAVFGLIVFILFEGGNTLSDGLTTLWSAWLSPPINAVITGIAHASLWAKILRWGFDDGLLAAVSVGIPYVLIFYFLLSFLEDTGYLNAAAFLVDRFLHAVGLHGRAFIPLAAAIGCNVPAVIGTRILTSKRERVIAIILIVLISCSARTAVIIGAVSRFLGWGWALLIFFIDGAIVVGAGMLMHRYTSGESEGFVMEVFPLRYPHMGTVVKKTWVRFADFVWIATPIVVAGSMVLGWLYETGFIWKLSRPLSPVIEGWLGLPPFAGLTLLFAILRKELALQFLVTLAVAQEGHSIDNLLHIMTREQLFTFTLFNTLYLPCLATIAVIQRELGLRWTVAILGAVLAFSVLFVGLVHHLLLMAGVFAIR
ncbi:MAG: ferrous iron transport protein B [Candidatus Eremiobacteraeota bacterium]|nr:ferrous iron transport protein B [Candidatus Eremiobacteraeota bacterium]